MRTTKISEISIGFILYHQDTKDLWDVDYIVRVSDNTSTDYFLVKCDTQEGSNLCEYIDNFEEEYVKSNKISEERLEQLSKNVSYDELYENHHKINSVSLCYEFRPTYYILHYHKEIGITKDSFETYLYNFFFEILYDKNSPELNLFFENMVEYILEYNMLSEKDIENVISEFERTSKKKLTNLVIPYIRRRKIKSVIGDE